MRIILSNRVVAKIFYSSLPTSPCWFYIFFGSLSFNGYMNCHPSLPSQLSMIWTFSISCMFQSFVVPGICLLSSNWMLAVLVLGHLFWVLLTLILQHLLSLLLLWLLLLLLCFCLWQFAWLHASCFVWLPFFLFVTAFCESVFLVYDILPFTPSILHQKKIIPVVAFVHVV